MKPVPSSKDWDVIELLKELESQKAAYPPELLSARRAAFLQQLDQRKHAETEDELSPSDQEIVTLLHGLKSIENRYPAQMLAARRSAFAGQLSKVNQPSVWDSLAAAIRNWWTRGIQATSSTTVTWLRTSAVLAILALAAFAGFLSYGSRDQTMMAASPPAVGEVQSGRVLTTDSRESSIICKPGFVPPLCLAGEANKEQDLAFQGNGSAQPAVAKDSMPGVGGIHQASHLNDGMYGPGSSWISRSQNSWVKIDLGKATTIDTVEFGRDRLGEYHDRSPGQFVISLALTDNVYANGNSSNDDLEYTEVYNSEQDGFTGTISGPETVTIRFDPQVARYIKITFEKAGTAIDEVQAFMLQPPVMVNNPTRPPKDNDEPEDTPTPLPTNTRRPTATATPLPTNTPLPTDTATSVPTNTPSPTNTATPVPTNTPSPTNTATPLPTHTPRPTNTPLPTNTQPPPATSTPLPTNPPPSTATVQPIPTELLFSPDWLLGIAPDSTIPTRTPFYTP